MERDHTDRFDDTPMWLSHHWPDQADRCVEVGGRFVCRRCAVLYPVSLVVAMLFGIGAGWPERWDPWFLWLLPLPAAVEFIGEQLRWWEHAPRRLVAVTLLLAVACGRLYVRYLDDIWDGLVWSVVSTYLVACVAAGFWRSFRAS